MTDIVRQVARYANVEALRALMPSVDSIPIRAVARDARGAVIGDATVSVLSNVGVSFHAPWAGPNAIVNAGTVAVVTPTIADIALPENNPLAPQVPVTINASNVTIVKVDTVKAGHTQIAVSLVAFDSTGLPALGAPVVFSTPFGLVPATVVTDFNGQATTTWTPPDTAGYFTLTGVRTSPLTAVPDSTGRIVIRRSARVIAADPDASKSTVEITATSIPVSGTATVTVKVRDIFNNLVKSALPTDFTVNVTNGSLSAFSCTDGVCTSSAVIAWFFWASVSGLSILTSTEPAATS